MKKIFYLFTCCVIFFSGHAQEDIILTVGNEKIPMHEFERVYLKNNRPNMPDRKSLTEYMDLYINFRLKVLEAKNRGLDTLESFINELSGYRDQLAKPYLNDTAALEKYIREAYERMQKEISVSLILVRCDPYASPKDSLAAYKKIMNLRDRIVKKQEPFEKVAREASEDQYARYNGGYYGYSIAFRYPYELETAIYHTKLNEVSMPVRTQYGYFIVKVNGIRPARGDVKVAHIMIVVPAGSSQEKQDSAKNKIFDIYRQLKEGADFTEMVKKYSEDRYSVDANGELPMFHAGQMVEVFEDSAFALKHPGDISMPCRTEYGWHIIRLIEKKPVGSYESLRKTIREYVMRDKRANAATDAIVEKVKKEYGLKVDWSKIKPFYTLIDSTIHRNDWDYEKAAGMKEPVLTVGDKVYTQYDFAAYIADPKNRQTIANIEIMTNEGFKKFIKEKALDYYKDKLYELDENFRNIMNEYRDGILLFNITDQEVWSKAMRDTIGLQAFYESVKHKYMWKERMKADIYTCHDKKTAEQVKKILAKNQNNSITLEQIALKVCKDSLHKCISVKSGIFEKGENAVIDAQKWEKGIAVTPQDTVYYVVVKKDVLPAEPKKLNEARGFIIADYQSHLEEQWVKELRNKYPVYVNKELLARLEEKYKSQ